MSRFEIHPDSLKGAGLSTMMAQGSLAIMAMQLGNIDMNGIGGSQTQVLQESINRSRDNIIRCNRDISNIESALSKIIKTYNEAENNLVSNLFGKAADIIMPMTSVGAAVTVGANAVAVGNDSKMGDGTKKLIQNLLKYIMKNNNEGSEKIVDIGIIIEKIKEGKYLDAIEKLPGLFGIKGWDFTSGVTMNTALLKFDSIIKTLKLVADPKGYITANQSKYEQMMLDYAKDGNILGVISTMSGMFVQTVGKGVVDVTCQLISGGVDTLLKGVTGGLLDLSTINAVFEEHLGFSAGTIFSAATDAISTGVDYVVDGVVTIVGKTGEVVDELIGGAISAGGKAIKGICNWVKGWF